MKQLLTLLSLSIVFLLTNINASHAQTYNWVKGGGTNQDLTTSVYDEEVDYMCTDAHGNVYTIGIVGNNPITADTFSRPGAYGAANNVFVTSYNCEGQMRWAKLISSANGTHGFGIAADSYGHIYVSGSFIHLSGSHTLFIGYDTSIPTYNYMALGLIQFDTSGEFNWIKFIGDNTSVSITAVGGYKNPLIVDVSNNVHFLCNTKPGAILTPTITSHYGIYDMVYNTSGTLIDATKLQFDSTLAIEGATIDNDNKLYIYGTRNNDFYSSLSYHNYIAAFDAARNLIWTDTISNPVSPGNAGFSSIVADGYGHLYVNANGSGKVIYRGDTAKNILSTISYPITSIMKLDVMGNLKWRKTFSCNSDYNSFLDLKLMPNNKIAAIGYMFATVKCGTHVINNYGGEGREVYFTILDSAGYIHNLEVVHGSGAEDIGYAVATDNKGNLYLGGSISYNVWGGVLTPYMSVGGNTDYFIMKYGIDCDCTGMPTANYTVTGGTTKTFTYTGTTAGIDSVRWDFGDGGTSTAFSPTHTYTTGDTFTACITVYSHCGSDMHCSDFIIPCVSAPTASFTTAGAGLAKTFTFSGSGLGTGTLSWNFGDGSSIGSGSPVSHTYAGAGTYNVCVTAANPCGSNTSCTTITITCTTLPASAFTSSGTSLTKSFAYTGTTTGMDSVTWTFGDGAIATGTMPTHTYLIAGTYTVCATVHTNCGDNTTCHAVTVSCPSLPVSAFTYTGAGATTNFFFTGTTPVDSVKWNFGDGSSTAALSPSHTYLLDGTYHVCATVYTHCGSATTCHDVVISCVSPVIADFSDTGHTHHGFVYTGYTTGLDSVRWNYGDGHSDTGIHHTHTYALADTYHVCATVFTHCGSDTVCRDIIITYAAGVEDVSMGDIKVYPNPATNELYITGITQHTDYRVLSIAGVSIKNGSMKSGNNTLILPDIAPGIYILEMTGENGLKNVVRVVKD